MRIVESLRSWGNPGMIIDSGSIWTRSRYFLQGCTGGRLNSRFPRYGHPGEVTRISGKGPDG